MTPERWQALKSIFESALSVPPGERGAFVRKRCSGDSSLENSVLVLLDHNEAACSILDGPPLTGARLAEIVSAGIRTFLPGELAANRFRIVRFIAEGGMGEVYAADDLELGEIVALKTIRPTLAGEQHFLVRFKQEIQLARKVTHRNVSRVYDLFRHEVAIEGTQRTIYFVSMEFLEGETLADRIAREGPLPAGAARTLALQILDGLAEAHAAGIVHRDLSSRNVGIASGPAGERAVIMDFGLAGTRAEFAAESHRVPAGTPPFMAPEQFSGGLITPATDIYAIGIVLHHMISGASSIDVPASPSIPAAWKSTIEACLDPDPKKRPQTAAEVSSRLSGRFELRRKLRVSAALALLLLASAAAWSWSHRPHRPIPAAQAALDDASVKLQNHSPAGFREAIAGFQRAAQLDPNWAEPWADMAYTFADAANTSQLPGETASRDARRAALQAIRLDNRSAKAFGALGWVQSLDFDDWPRAETTLRRALELDPSDAHVHWWLGVHLRKRARFPEAELEDRRALALSHEADPQIWCELAFLYWTSGRLDAMRNLMNDLLVAHPNFGLTRFLNARLLKEEGRFDEAVEELNFSQSLQYSPITVLVERASIEAYRGNRAAALTLIHRLELAAQTGPVDGLLVAGVYARLGDPDAALNWLDRSYARRDSTLLSIATSPTLAPLRSSPRFRDLLRRLHYSA